MSESWEWVNLDKLGKVLSGRPRDKMYSSFYSLFNKTDSSFFWYVPVIDGKTVNENQYLYIWKYSSYYINNCFEKYKLFPKNTICFIRSGSSAGYSSLTKENVYITENIHTINSYKKISDPIFIKYCFDFSKVKEKLFSFTKYSTAQPNLTKSKFSLVKFPKPPLEIQQKIGKILSKYDLILDNHEKQVKLLKELKKSLFREWFVKLRFPEYEKYSIEKEIPEGWKKIKFGDLTKIQIGRKPVSHANLLDGKGKYPFFTCSTKTKRSYTFSYDFPSLLVSAGGAITVSFMMGNLKQAPTFLFRN